MECGAYVMMADNNNGHINGSIEMPTDFRYSRKQLVRLVDLLVRPIVPSRGRSMLVNISS